jgi:hypothetical protein
MDASLEKVFHSDFGHCQLSFVSDDFADGRARGFRGPSGKTPLLFVFFMRNPVSPGTLRDSNQA